MSIPELYIKSSTYEVSTLKRYGVSEIPETITTLNWTINDSLGRTATLIGSFPDAYGVGAMSPPHFKNLREGVSAKFAMMEKVNSYKDSNAGLSNYLKVNIDATVDYSDDNDTIYRISISRKV